MAKTGQRYDHVNSQEKTYNNEIRSRNEGFGEYLAVWDAFRTAALYSCVSVRISDSLMILGIGASCSESEDIE
jgi:hypothetical protein